jgi:hypothetical protein
LLSQKEEDGMNVDEEQEQIPKSYGTSTKDARATITLILDVISFSKKIIDSSESQRLEGGETLEVNEIRSFQGTRNTTSDNILFGLLFLDGLIMINIDLIKKIDQFAPLLGLNLQDFLFSILEDRFLDDNTKEVASHLLAAELSFVRPESVHINKWKTFINWTLDYYNTK